VAGAGFLVSCTKATLPCIKGILIAWFCETKFIAIKTYLYIDNYFIVTIEGQCKCVVRVDGIPVPGCPMLPLPLGSVPLSPVFTRRYIHASKSQSTSSREIFAMPRIPSFWHLLFRATQLAARTLTGRSLSPPHKCVNPHGTKRLRESPPKTSWSEALSKAYCA
jgi:hypothetical protein